ncbi:MAG: (Fe-S)-binding protein [Erysipelotrichaceae bacterium]
MFNAIVMMLVLGAALGLLLGLAGAFLYVEPDTRVEQVLAMLPGYNCGACGYAGCSGLAQALVDKEVTDPKQCKPSTLANQTRIATFLSTGQDPSAVHSHG